MSLNCSIPANPDIAGIGIRASIYAQAILVIIPVILAPAAEFSGGWNSETFFEDMKGTSVAVLTTGCAILVSSFIQAQLYGLSLYHALIVLNLSWLNNLTAFVPVLLELGVTATGTHDMTLFRLLTSAPKSMVAFILHLTATGAFGIWLFCRVDDFGVQSECNPSIVWVAAGHSISGTSKPLRAIFITISTIAAFPILNIVVCVGLFVGLMCLGELGWHAKLPLGLVLALLAWIIPCLLLIIGTEQTVLFNKAHIQPGEGDWTFGQTLALLLLFVPLWTAVTHLWDTIFNRYRS